MVEKNAATFFFNIYIYIYILKAFIFILTTNRVFRSVVNISFQNVFLLENNK